MTFMQVIDYGQYYRSNELYQNTFYREAVIEKITPEWIRREYLEPAQQPVQIFPEIKYEPGWKDRVDDLEEQCQNLREWCQELMQEIEELKREKRERTDRPT